MPCNIKGLICIVAVVALFTGCDIINPSEPDPSYIRVDTVKVNNSPSTSKVHEIEDVWIYIGGELVGAYQVPFTVPVLPSGNQTVTLEPGIKESGQTLYRRMYPFMQSIKADTLLPEEDTLIINPQFDYISNLQTPMNEDFEQLGSGFEITESSDTTLMVTNDSITINGRSGYIVLDEEHTQFDCRSSDVYNLPPDRKVYLELEYYSEDANLTAGVFAKELEGSNYIDVRYSVIQLFPDNKWRKVYINLTEIIASKPQALGFRIFFSALKPENTEGEKVELYIDNIKLLHY